MLALKDLPIFVSSRRAQQAHRPHLLDPIQVIKKKAFRMSEQNRKQQNSQPSHARLSHKTIHDQTALSKARRRISTAGTSKRFPKDFFKMDDLCQDHSPKFVLKLSKKELENSLQNANQPLRVKTTQDNSSKAPQQKQMQNTPKFHEPDVQMQADKSVNQFLILEGAPKVLAPFLSLGDQTGGGRPVGFIKKVKKGQLLRRQNHIHRTFSQNEYPETNILNLNKIRGCCY